MKSVVQIYCLLTLCKEQSLKYPISNHVSSQIYMNEIVQQIFKLSVNLILEYQNNKMSFRKTNFKFLKTHQNTPYYQLHEKCNDIIIFRGYVKCMVKLSFLYFVSVCCLFLVLIYAYFFYI